MNQRLFTMSEYSEGKPRLMLGKLYQNYQQNIDSTTEDDFLDMNIPLEQIRNNLKELESQNLVHIGERKGAGILQHIQITKQGIKKIEEACSCD